MTKDELINKFPKPLYDFDLSKDKVKELIELCMNAKSVNMLGNILYNFIDTNVPHIDYIIRDDETLNGILSESDIEHNLKHDQYLAWFYGFSDYNVTMYKKYSDYLKDKHVKGAKLSVKDWFNDVIDYYKKYHKSTRTLYDTCKIASDIVYKDIFQEEFQSMRTKYHNDQTLMCQLLGSYIKQKYMNKISNKQKIKFYNELMKFFMYPKYFGYNDNGLSYIFKHSKYPRKIKKFLKNPNSNNINGRNMFNKIKRNKLSMNDRRLISDYGPQGDLYNIFKNSGISENIANRICPWKEYAYIDINDMSVNVNGKYY